MSNQDLIDQVEAVKRHIEGNSPECADCGEVEADVGELCPSCEELIVGEYGAFDIIKQALDIEYTISSSGEFLGARILMCCGGPNVWVDTRNDLIEGYWGGDVVKRSFSDDLGLFDCAEELYAVLRN